MKPIGTKVYYIGDMANQDGNFEVFAHRGGGRFGFTYDLREIGGKREMLGVYHISDTYNGTCSERFVTQEARAAYREASIKEMERAAHRRAYIARQPA